MQKNKSTQKARLLAFALAVIALFALTGFVRPVAALADSAQTAAESDAPPTSLTAESEIPADGTPTDTPSPEAEAEEETAQPFMEFVLFEKLKKIDTKGWIFFAAAAVITAAMTVYLVTRKKEGGQPRVGQEPKPSPTLVLVHGALCIALSFVLSYIKLFSMQSGGSITLASMLPLMIYANRYGLKNGLLAGLVYGILQYFQGGYFVHWLQFIFDYPLAFALIGLAGLTRGERNLVFSVLIGGTARFISHFIGGVLFFGEFVMIGQGAETSMTFFQMLPTNISVSFGYNAPYMFADIAICAVIALLPPFRKAIKTALKY